jgi:hypothetical protein
VESVVGHEDVEDDLGPAEVKVDGGEHEDVVSCTESELEVSVEVRG